LTDVDLSIGNKRTPRQDAKSKAAQDDEQHNAAQDDEQHNATLKRRNHKKKLDMCENHLFRLKEKEENDVEGVIISYK